MELLQLALQLEQLNYRQHQQLVNSNYPLPLLIIPSFGWLISGDDRRVVIQQIEKEIEEARDIVGIALN